MGSWIFPETRKGAIYLLPSVMSPSDVKAGLYAYILHTVHPLYGTVSGKLWVWPVGKDYLKQNETTSLSIGKLKQRWSILDDHRMNECLEVESGCFS